MLRGWFEDRRRLTLFVSPLRSRSHPKSSDARPADHRLSLPRVRTPGRAAVGQTNLYSYVHFWHSFHCSACGQMLEGDAGETPEDARQAILAAYGVFALHVEAEGAARLVALKLCAHCSASRWPRPPR